MSVSPEHLLLGGTNLFLYRGEGEYPVIRETIADDKQGLDVIFKIVRVIM